MPVWTKVELYKLAPHTLVTSFWAEWSTDRFLKFSITANVLLNLFKKNELENIMFETPTFLLWEFVLIIFCTVPMFFGIWRCVYMLKNCVCDFEEPHKNKHHTRKNKQHTMFICWLLVCQCIVLRLWYVSVSYVFDDIWRLVAPGSYTRILQATPNLHEKNLLRGICSEVLFLRQGERRGRWEVFTPMQYVLAGRLRTVDVCIFRGRMFVDRDSITNTCYFTFWSI